MLTQEEMMVLFRDMMTAMDVGQKAEMGYYDVEFDTYGCVHYSRQERFYHVSANGAKIYDFMERAALDDLYPSVIIEDVFKKPIPRGFKDILALDLKKDLAKRMQQLFSPDFMARLQQLAGEMTQNCAGDLLNTYMDSLECTFDRDQFNLFESTLVFAVNHKKLMLKDYQLLLSRLNEERQNISTELRPHDIFNQTFHAFAYWQDDRFQFVYDARKDYVYEKKLALELAGALVSPLFTKTYFYNYEYRLSDVRQDFLHDLPAIFSEPYRQLLLALRALPAKASSGEFRALIRDITRDYGPEAGKTLKMYGSRWDILR